MLDLTRDNYMDYLNKVSPFPVVNGWVVCGEATVSHTHSLAPTSCVSPVNQAKLKSKCIAKEEKDSTMNIEREKTYYLDGRLHDVLYTKLNELNKQFGLADDDMPNNPQEAVDRITAGKFLIKKKDWYNHWTDGLRWRDPAVVEDKDGFKKAEKALKDAYSAAKDTVHTLTAEAGLKALQDFQSWKYTN